MRKPLSTSLALVAAAVFLSACGPKPATTNTAPAANANAAKPAAAATNTAPAPSATNTAAPAAGDQLSTLAIHNKSKWAVHHLYLSPANENEWGPDQLGQKTIDPGGTFTLNSIPCNTYDIKVEDEDGDACMIKGEKFCGHDATWDLTDQELLGCEGYGDKE